MPCVIETCAVSSEAISSIISFSSSAANPDNSPTTSANMSTKFRSVMCFSRHCSIFM